VASGPDGLSWTTRATVAHPCTGRFGVAFYTPGLPGAALELFHAGAGTLP
jgi:hypothetical protein